MVFFHGGGWQCGSGVSYFYGPDFLMDHKVIYVAANFRLGPLGFLSTGNLECPGNFGLKDQVLVLRWIRENIAAFGGNRDSVTVFGESAGGASGTYMMMSPQTKGLFHRSNPEVFIESCHKPCVRIEICKILISFRNDLPVGEVKLADCSSNFFLTIHGMMVIIEGNGKSSIPIFIEAVCKFWKIDERGSFQCPFIHGYP
uniref:Carboxylic ester hydrolase n=1 Tax=Phlebotomus papatasi TaxID=29031 RepID=A0A1B0D936_PHLPP